MTISIKPTASGSTIEQDGSTVLSIESDRSVDIDSGTFHVDATNNRVGIGTSSPSTKLQVNTTGGGVFQVTDWGTSSQIGTDTAGQALRVNGVDSVRFHTGTAGSQAERMRIDSNGYVLMGTTSTGSPYVTQGFGFITVSGSYMSIGHASGTANGQPYAVFAYNGASIGYIGQNTTSTVSYNTSSDYRLKENIQPMTGGLNKVLQLNPVTWTWKSDGASGQGFIAHEAKAVVPDCVMGEKDAVDDDGNPVYQGIDTSFLVATLTKAIQEQQEQIKALETRIQALESN